MLCLCACNPYTLTLTFYLSRDTFIEREPGESANDRNDRAIRMAAKWYSQHLKTSESNPDGLKVVLLTNDQGNKQKAEESGLLVHKCKWRNKMLHIGCRQKVALLILISFNFSVSTNLLVKFYWIQVCF